MGQVGQVGQVGVVLLLVLLLVQLSLLLLLRVCDSGIGLDVPLAAVAASQAEDPSTAVSEGGF